VIERSWLHAQPQLALQLAMAQPSRCIWRAPHHRLFCRTDGVRTKLFMRLAHTSINEEIQRDSVLTLLAKWGALWNALAFTIGYATLRYNRWVFEFQARGLGPQEQPQPAVEDHHDGTSGASPAPNLDTEVPGTMAAGSDRHDRSRNGVAHAVEAATCATAKTAPA
jgi:hypothetical protein